MTKDPPATLDEPDTDCEVIEKLRAENGRLRAILEAARLYEKWAQKGDYPHDEEGCEAHEAIRKAVRDFEQTGDGK